LGRERGKEGVQGQIYETAISRLRVVGILEKFLVTVNEKRVSL